MRSSRSAASVVICAAAVLLGGVGCSSSNQPSPHAIAGTVSGAVQAGVTVTLSGAASAAATTDASGNYRFSGLGDGNYMLTPSLAGYTFTPSTASVMLAGADVTGRNFTAAPLALAHTISGTVSGSVQAGVTITLGGSASATTTTDGSGNYHFSGLADGSYTVAATLTGYSFTPVLLPVMLAGADATGRNFTAVVEPPSTHTISGTITGAAQGGVTIALSGTANSTTTTDGYGNYQFVGLADGSYTMTPTSPWYTFTPANVSVALSGADATGRNFTASGRCIQTTADTSGLTLYDDLCGPTLDGSRWQQPGAFVRRVSSGAAWLRTAMANEEPRSVRNSIYSSYAAPIPPRAGDRVTTVRADVMVPSATASRSGGADVRAVVRLLYQPPLTRLVFPGAWQDLLVLEVGLLDAGNGLQAYRQVLHCDDQSCVTLSMAGVGFVDPPDFVPLGAGLQAGAPAAYDTSYTVAASLDETTGLLHWSIAGGAFGTAGRSGTADPTSYLGSSTNWAGVPLAGPGFMSAQIGTSSRDSSSAGGGSADVTGRFKNVYVGINDAAATLWDDFSGTGANSGPGGFAIAKWGSWGNTSSLPSTGGLVQNSYLQSPQTGGTTGYGAVVTNNVAFPEDIATIQADVGFPSPVIGSSPQAFLQGRFYNDGTAGGVANSALGDITAMVRITPTNASASWLVLRCPNATCTGAVGTVGTGTIPLSSLSPLHTLRVGFDPTAHQFRFGVDGNYVTVDPTVTGNGITSPAPYSGAAHAPFRSLGSSASVSSTTTTSSMQARFSSVYVATGPSACNAIVNDATPVTLTQVAQDAPTATGGALVDGTYRLTAWTMYTGTAGATGPLGLTMTQVFIVAGNTIQLVGQQSGQSEQRGTATVTTSGNQVTLTPTCGNVTPSTNAYTASGTEFRTYSNDTSGVSEAVFTRQ